ncbi:MAG: GNAT family N-acetyltransferase [Nocardioidaceae bacterium]
MTDRPDVAGADQLPVGYVVRPLTDDDAVAVSKLIAACELHDLGEVQIELEDIVAEWQRPTFDLTSESIAVHDPQRRLVGYAEVYRARRAEAYVHPQARGRGIGSALLGWTHRLVRERGGNLVGQSLPEKCRDGVALLRARGYKQLWTSWILELPAGAEIADAELAEGTTIRALRPGRDEQAAYQTIEDAFREWPDRDPVTYEDSAAGVLRRPGFEPWQLLLAVEQHGSAAERVVGACFVSPSGDTGWVQQLAVRRDRRGRGLARALLLRAFAETRARGATRAELATDSRTGALGAYQRLGMQVKETYVHWARELDPDD